MPAQPMAIPPRTPMTLGDAGRREGAERVGDPVREHLERRVDPAEDAVGDDALDQRQLGDALDRLEAVADELRQEHHQRSRRAAGPGRAASGRRAIDAPIAVQMSAGPSPSRRMTRCGEQRADERADAAGRDDDAEQERRQVQVLDQVDRVQDAVERAGDVGDDRAQDERERAPGGGGRAAGPRRSRRGSASPSSASGRAGSGARISSSEIAETANETASTRIANGALTSWTRPPARPGPPISAIDELVASLLLPSTTRSTPISDGT